MSLHDRIEISEYKMIVEPRGWFQKPLTGLTVPLAEDSFGEIYVVKAFPGEFRGNHYHERATEWFFVVAGEATAYLQDADSGESCSLRLSEEDNQCLRISARVAHVFVNEDEKVPFVLAAYTDRLFSPEDTIPFVVPTL